MIIRKQKIINFLIVPTLILFLYSCNSNNTKSIGGFFKEIIVFIGSTIKETAIGLTIEKILDEISLFNEFKEEKLIGNEVIQNPENPLKGQLSDKFTMEGKKEGNEKKIIEITIDKARVVRSSKIEKNWTLAPDLKQLIKQVFKKEIDGVTNPEPCEYTDPGIVIPESTNKLKGQYNKTMTIDGTDKSGKPIIFLIKKPVMVKQDPTSKWELAPDLTQVLEQTTKEYQKIIICIF